MDFSTYKAFLFDVDKTLTNSKKEISQTTKDVLKRLEEKYTVGVCTGRHFATLKKLLSSSFLSNSLHIVCGGGQIVRLDGTVLQAHNIPAETAKKLSDLATTYNSRFLFQYANELYGNQEAILHAQNYFLTDDTFSVPKPIDQIPDWGGCALITVGNISDDFIVESKKLPIPVKVMTNYNGKKYIDVTAPGVNKSTGILEWCKMTGIKPEEIIGFGDSENDIEFLQTVGYSVAMGNATDEVKAVADEVTQDCDHDGVAAWIEKNIL